MSAKESFEDWWESKGRNLYPPSAKAGIWIAFADGWYRGQKSK